MFDLTFRSKNVTLIGLPTIMISDWTKLLHSMGRILIILRFRIRCWTNPSGNFHIQSKQQSSVNFFTKVVIFNSTPISDGIYFEIQIHQIVSDKNEFLSMKPHCIFFPIQRGFRWVSYRRYPCVLRNSVVELLAQA